MSLFEPTDQIIASSFFNYIMMGARLHWLEQARDGLDQTGVALVGVDQNHLPTPIPVGDDLGFYALIPFLCRLFGTGIADTTVLLMVLMVGVGIVIGAVLWCRAFSGWGTRVYGLGMMAVLGGIALFVTGDFYVTALMATVILVPLAVLLARRPAGLDGPGTWVALLAVGAMAGAANVLRSQAATPGLVLLGLVLLFRQDRWFRKLLMLVVLAGGVAGPLLAVRQLLVERDGYLSRTVSGYTPGIDAHVFWHSVYIGFGFLQNPYGLAYRDDVAMAAAARIDPAIRRGDQEWQYDYPAHEAAVRRATLQLFLQHPVFVAKTLFAKAGVMVLYFLAFLNLGLVFLVRRAWDWRIDGAVVPALLVAAAPGLLVMPNINYIMAFVAIAALYGGLCAGATADHRRQAGAITAPAASIHD